jgi:hypothetical protein
MEIKSIPMKKNVQPTIRTLLEKVNKSHYVTNSEGMKVSDDWLDDGDITNMIKMFQFLGGEKIYNIMDKNGCINGGISKQKIRNPDPKDVPETEWEKEAVIIPSNVIETLIGKLSNGCLFEIHETADRCCKDGTNPILISDDESEDQKSDPNNNAPPQKKRKKDLEFLPMRVYKPIKDYYPTHLHNNIEELEFNYFQILYTLGIGSLGKSWISKTSVLLIPIHGPFTSIGLRNNMDLVMRMEREKEREENALGRTYIKKKPYQLRDHWSLLCYYPKEGAVYHYDPILRSNGESYNEERVCEVVSLLKSFNIIDPNATEYISGEKRPDFVTLQTKGFECGHYVVYWMLMILAKKPCRPLSNHDIKRRYAKFEKVCGDAYSHVMTNIIRECIDAIDYFV